MKKSHVVGKWNRFVTLYYQSSGKRIRNVPDYSPECRSYELAVHKARFAVRFSHHADYAVVYLRDINSEDLREVYSCGGIL